MPESQVPSDFQEKLLRVWQLYKVPLCLGGVSAFVICVSLILLVKSIQTSTPIQFISNQDVIGDSTQASVSANQQKMIHVDVEGGVRAPGVYVLPSASRIDDAIAKAGGLSEEADEEAIAKQLNRASILVDGAKIYIPMKGDVQDSSYNLDTAENSNMTSYNNLININTASENELDSLPGVGPVTAKKIIDNRPYQTLDELVTKKAMSQSLLEKLRNSLIL